jgi:hypothetical protein
MEPPCGAFFCIAPPSHAFDFTWYLGKDRIPTSLGNNQAPSWIHDVSFFNMFRLSATVAPNPLENPESVQFQAEL